MFTVWNENFSKQQNREIQTPTPTSQNTEEELVSVNTENYFAQEFNFQKRNTNLEAELTRGRSNLAAGAYDDDEGTGEDSNTHQYFNQEFQFNRENLQTERKNVLTRRISIPSEKQRKIAKTTDDEYEDLVQLVEQLNKKFSRFKKFIRISDQEVDFLKKPTTMQEVSITRKPTPQSRRRQHQEVEPAIEKPPLDLKRIKKKTNKTKFIKNKKNGKIRQNGHQKMPSFPNFPQTEREKKRPSLGRSRVGDLPEFASNTEDYPERMLSSVVYLSHGIRV